MPSTAETYRDAARQNLLRAQECFDADKYFLAHYLSGLAVERHLRAYLRRVTNQFASGHDLRDLAKEANFFDIVPRNQVNDFSTKFTILNLRWRSNHRYYSERQFLDYMTEIKAEFGIKDERWKNLARTVLNLAYEVIKENRNGTASETDFAAGISRHRN